jgi:hypothetical protein
MFNKNFHPTKRTNLTSYKLDFKLSPCCECCIAQKREYQLHATLWPVWSYIRVNLHFQLKLPRLQMNHDYHTQMQTATFGSLWTFFAWVANLPTTMFIKLADIQKVLNTSGYLPRDDRAKRNGAETSRTACLNTTDSVAFGYLHSATTRWRTRGHMKRVQH